MRRSKAAAITPETPAEIADSDSVEVSHVVRASRRHLGTRISASGSAPARQVERRVELLQHLARDDVAALVVEVHTVAGAHLHRVALRVLQILGESTRVAGEHRVRVDEDRLLSARLRLLLDGGVDDVESLREFDAWLGEFIPQIEEGDLVILTADHGNDPYHPGTDHTREQIPVMVVGLKDSTGDGTFADVARWVEKRLIG